MKQTGGTSKTVAVVGDDEFVLGFQLAGVRRAVVARTTDELSDALPKLLDDRAVGIVVTKAADVARLAPPLRNRITESVDPVVIQMGAGASGVLRDKIRNAIGIDLLSE